METVNFFSILFLVLATAKVVVQLYLLRRNQLHVEKNKGQVPAEFRDSLGLGEHQKAAAYSMAKDRFQMFSLCLHFILLMLWLPAGGLEWLSELVEQRFLPQSSSLVQGLGLVLSFMIISTILSIPESYYQTFVLEEKFGFNKTTLSLFIKDFFKQALLFAILGLPFLYALLWFMQSLGPQWWITAWAFIVSFQFFLLLIYPQWIAPLFNKFTPLSDQEVQSKLENLLGRIGFAHKGIFVMDASRRSSHGNAYFTGFGKSKRIVFFDNLLKSLSSDEIIAVLAHELGHFKKRHITKRLVLSLVTTFIGLGILGVLTENPLFYQAHWSTGPNYAKALLLFSLVSPLYTFFITPLSSWFSRRHEYEADEFASQNAKAQDLINALVKLYKENASTLTPDPLYSRWYYSHPPASERVAFLKKLKN